MNLVDAEFRLYVNPAVASPAGSAKIGNLTIPADVDKVIINPDGVYVSFANGFGYNFCISMAGTVTIN